MRHNKISTAFLMCCLVLNFTSSGSASIRHKGFEWNAKNSDDSGYEKINQTITLNEQNNESENSNYHKVEWSSKPADFDNFNLPLMVINTNGQTIPDEPRIVADMGLIYNGEGKINRQTDSWNEYSGKISIERRGESSSGFKKKSYSIELQKEDGTNNNVSILNLPEENDFVLYGPYSDKTLIKNVLSYELFRRTGRWSPRTRYIELILNNEYRGIYVLTEKLKRDDNRVDIDKLDENDVSHQEISGGYILRRDKKGKLTFDEYWTSPVEQPYHERMWYEYYDPKYDELTIAQQEYIKNWMEDFDKVMSGNNFKDPVQGYAKYIRVNSFIDMMFLNEISKGIDNYMFSTYFFKENDEDGGLLNAGPPWDYNIGYGNVNYGDDWNASSPEGWGYPQGSRTYWFERLMEDADYREKVYCRWTNYRKSIFSDEEIEGVIDSCVSVLGEAVTRNFEKYPILGEYYWPAIYWPETYEEEVYNLKAWLFDRLNWIDSEWFEVVDCSKIIDNSALPEHIAEKKVNVYPNPSDFSNLTFEIKTSGILDGFVIEIYDLYGKIIARKESGPINDDKLLLHFTNLYYLESGFYIYKIYNSHQIIDVGKLNKVH